MPFALTFKSQEHIERMFAVFDARVAKRNELYGRLKDRCFVREEELTAVNSDIVRCEKVIAAMLSINGEVVL